MTPNKRKPTISVIGLGKLGACTAAALASRGMEVIGVDIDDRSIKAINSGKSPVSEPGLDTLINEHRERLRATSSYDDAVRSSDITLILVPTPSTTAGGFSLEHVRQAAAKVGRSLGAKQDYHVVVLVSTVLPGSCESEVIPILEQSSGKKCGPDFGFCYGPEFIALGSVVRDFLNPDFVLIGEFDSQSGDALELMYRHSCMNQPPVQRMNIVNAELTKISVNTFVTTKITFANMLAELCGRLPGANVDIVTGAMGLDSRIGRRYLTGAVSYGGPCFPRDNIAFSYLARSLGANAGLAEATHSYNLAHRQWLLDRICEVADPDSTIAIVGLTYRPGTVVLEQAIGMWLASQLASSGRDVIVYDENALKEAVQVLGRQVRYAESLPECLQSDMIVLLDAEADLSLLLEGTTGVNPTKRRTVLDCWRVGSDTLASAKHLHYVPLGVGLGTDQTSTRAIAVAQ